MINQSIAELLRNFALKPFDFFVLELDHATTVNINQMIVMLIGYFFIAGSPVAEIMALQNFSFLEQSNRPINRRNTNPGIDIGRPTIYGFNIGVIGGFRQNTRNNSPLFCHFEPPVEAEAFQARLQALLSHVVSAPV